MLYHSWRQVAEANRDRLALCETCTGRRWTFRQLAAAAEAEPADTSPIAFPQAASADFVLQLLRAWRCNQLVCPVETGHPAPLISGPLPRGIVHVKTTSATTGTPRLVAFTAEQLVADAKNIVL